MKETSTLLSGMLECAVSLWAMKFRDLNWEEMQEIMRKSQDVLADKAADLLYRSKKKGDSADAFNATARAIAALSFCPGGVTAFGGHWENKFKPRRERL